MKLIVAGGRDYSPKRQHIRALRVQIFLEKVTEIISGGAEGGDLVGELVAHWLSLPIITYEADWNSYGNAAGPIRNAEMAKVADALFVFPGGKGTANMIKTMKALDKPIFYAEG